MRCIDPTSNLPMCILMIHAYTYIHTYASCFVSEWSLLNNDKLLDDATGAPTLWEQKVNKRYDRPFWQNRLSGEISWVAPKENPAAPTTKSTKDRLTGEQAGTSSLAASHLGKDGAAAIPLVIGISQAGEDALMTIAARGSGPDQEDPIIIDFRDILLVELDEAKSGAFRMLVASQAADTAPLGYLSFRADGAAAKHCESWLTYLVGIRDFYRKK